MKFCLIYNKLNIFCKLTVLQANIVDVVADAIVHPTNNSFYMGGQVGTAISLKGGHEQKKIIDEFYAKRGNLGVGGGNIKLKY